MIKRALHWLADRCRPRPRPPQSSTKDCPATGDAQLATMLQAMRDGCSECGSCARSCAFLSEHGLPGPLAARCDFNDPLQQRIAYACSLCGLCAVVCPEHLDPCRLFLAIRRRHVEAGHFNPTPYRTLLGYERIGTSRLFSLQAIPRECTTVFFPGCALPGTRPTVTLQIYHHLRQRIPSLGLLLGCCTKPSHDLGRNASFHARFNTMIEPLRLHGVHTVLTACPNCTTILHQYGQGLTVRTVYEVFQDSGLAATLPRHANAEVSVHDPCPLRNDSQVQAAVRSLLTDLGYAVVEMKHHKHRTICCGEGGGVGFVAPHLAQAWTRLRHQEAQSRMVVTYCAGCVGTLRRETPTIHLADLLFRPEAVRNNTLTIARPPMTFINRLLLKQKLRKIVRDDVV